MWFDFLFFFCDFLLAKEPGEIYCIQYIFHGHGLKEARNNVGSGPAGGSDEPRSTLFFCQAPWLKICPISRIWKSRQTSLYVLPSLNSSISFFLHDVERGYTGEGRVKSQLAHNPSCCPYLNLSPYCWTQIQMIPFFWRWVIDHWMNDGIQLG